MKTRIRGWIGSRQVFDAYVVFHIGDGALSRLSSFWQDPLFLDHPIKDALPEIFKHCTKRNLLIKEALNEQRLMRHLKEQPIGGCNLSVY
jgi:hypothetical protein